MAADRCRQDPRPLVDATGPRTGQDCLLDRPASTGHQRPAVRLRVRPPALDRGAPSMADELFNACRYLLDRRIDAGDGDRLAVTGTEGELTYGALLERVQRTATVLSDLGLQPEQRLLMCMADGPDFVGLYLAAMRIGAIPVPVSTMQTAAGLAELLRDSRARLLAVSAAFGPLARGAIGDAPELRGVLAAGGADVG